MKILFSVQRYCFFSICANYLTKKLLFLAKKDFFCNICSVFHVFKGHFSSIFPRRVAAEASSILTFTRSPIFWSVRGNTTVL